MLLMLKLIKKNLKEKMRKLKNIMKIIYTNLNLKIKD